MKNGSDKKYDICIVGGAGHVGLPLAITFASKGFRVIIYDLHETNLKRISQGELPFTEKGAQPLLEKVLADGLLHTSSDPVSVGDASTVIITIGTPVDEFMNPVLSVIKQCADDLWPYLIDGQLLVLRSTVYPGTTDWLDDYLKARSKKLKVAFCPERVVQGKAIEEIQCLPQLVSGVGEEAENEAADLFQKLAPEIVRLTPMEAEFAKLFNNAYRYIQFATANQFYMITRTAGVDYNRVLEGMKKNYPRAQDIPHAGFAAGPCLLKDTMQLAAFSNNQFTLGHAALNINEGLVLYLAEEIEKEYGSLRNLSVGLLGMAFKADSDDTRVSLSYKLKKMLMFRAREILTTDPHVTTDPDLLPLEEVVRRSDIMVLCVPHTAYHNLDHGNKPVVDIWGFLDRGK
ncbi:MAG: nucleotide sugar dehydrogenase [bacterium]|nr:nucleotide sugar dehydrogenase [bacterium]